ncbi:hypothetical protein [Chitinophaga japonensis]|uniref:Uncharacterized protein n=1 Tax=Chitinophaga japonensis TaxID=104662 RepID=A0A562T5F6_CHIJA|nr:hypothetical protein [Chitinophaga japonensis]TWI88765.1 hypothetical protein LX66_2851 [Chitinophaga japonensis]
MNRQITITLDGVQYMIDVEIERLPDAIVYHVQRPKQFASELPATFDITRPKHADQPQYDGQALTEKGRQIMRAVWEQLSTLPPQFAGGGGSGRI